MIFKILSSAFVALFITFNTNAEVPLTIEKKLKTNANIVGYVECCGDHIPYATVMVNGSTTGTTTDDSGYFQLIDIPTGEHTLKFSMIGYKNYETTVKVEKNKTTELKINIEKDIMGLDEVVVSADRNAQTRTEATVIVNSLSPKLYRTTQSLTFGEGLNFSPGLRMENNCQNCGYSQVRMNGMEGPYSQILINNRPIFSGLAGIYGLELLPSNMIERVEVVRGGGSALFGSNAIAGTINIILKDPISNSYEAASNYSLVGVGVKGSDAPANDYAVNFNGSVVSEERKSGMSVYGFTRKRCMFDANNDSFSELSQLGNITFGGRAFHKFNFRDKLALDFFAIHEERQGGNDFDRPYHERDISESLTHEMKVAALTYERFFREYDLLTIYGSGQFLDRDSYYGAEKSLSDYGYSQDRTYNWGAQYKALFGENSSLVAGLENTGGFLKDRKLGYADYDNAVIVNDSIVSVPHTEDIEVADQRSMTTGIFAQYDIRFGRAKISAGMRFDNYYITDNLLEDGATSGHVFSPRLSFMYDIGKNLQLRTSYSQGYRAPQIYDEDLHIETSGSRKVLHKNAPNLTQESSHSVMASFDLHKIFGNVYVSFLAEGFYTKLVDAFVNEIGEADEDGTVIYTRKNADGGANVQGLNTELKLKPMKNFQISAGFTLQSSLFQEAQDFNEKRFLRTPNTYGFFTLDWDFYKGFCMSTTGNYTGSMLVPHYDDFLIESEKFMDMGVKLSYKYKLNDASIEFSTGVKNIFNAYQSDFDTGINRDPAYIYGPITPRTIYFGVKFGNLL